MIGPPAPRPCDSCPYRRDVPSGVWDPSEYRKLPAYDLDTPHQPPSVFLCHQQDGRVCAGWVGCHDMDHSLALRLAGAMGQLDPADADAIHDYRSPVPLFGSGVEAMEHGLAGVERPGADAERAMDKIRRRRS